MRQFTYVLLLGFVLAFIAFQARTGIFRRKNPGEPANKYMRQMMESPQLSQDDAAILMQKYPTAHSNASGLRYVVRAPGEGNPVPAGAELTVNYTGTFLSTGAKFDSSYDRGQPYTFRVGAGAVIKGWDEAFATMRRGEKRTLIIPYWLAYGDAGRGAIPPRASLVFEVELLDFR